MESLKHYLKDKRFQYLSLSIALSLTAYLIYKYTRPSIHHLAILRDSSLLPILRNLQDTLTPLAILPLKESIPISSSHSGFDYGALARNDHPSVVKYARNIIYSTICESTSIILQDNFDEVSEGLIYVADSQIRGRGRTGDWLSPKGCLLFSYKFQCEIRYAVGINMIIPLAIVRAVKNIARQMHVDSSALDKIKVKWPNDVYLNDQKIAGILVNSSSRGKFIGMTIGIGINIDNSEPTTCLNDHFGRIFRSSHVLIEYLKTFDELYSKLMAEPNVVVQEYKDNWIHLNSECIYKPTGDRIKLIDVNLSGEIIAMKGSERIPIRLRDEVILPNEF